MAGASVAICTGSNPGTSPTPCPALATTYTDQTLTTPCTNNAPTPAVLYGAGCTNPGLTDSVGNAITFTNIGGYWAQVYGYQITPASFPFNTGGVGSTDRFVDLATGLFPVIDVRWYGAVGDGLQQNNCSMSIGTFNVTCSDVFGRTFVPTDVGKLAGITGAGTPDNFQSPLITTIAAYIGPHTVTLASAAIQSTSTQTITYGTDNASAYCAATECTQPLYTGIYG